MFRPMLPTVGRYSKETIKMMTSDVRCATIELKYNFKLVI